MDRIEACETDLAHLTRTVDELNEVVTAQSNEIRWLKKQVAALVARAQEAEPTGGIVFEDERPPHY